MALWGRIPVCFVSLRSLAKAVGSYLQISVLQKVKCLVVESEQGSCQFSPFSEKASAASGGGDLSRSSKLSAGGELAEAERCCTVIVRRLLGVYQTRTELVQ